MSDPDTARGDAEEASDLNRARAELEAERERFQSIIQRTADGIVVVDGAGDIRFANQAAERLFGRAADDLVGSPFGHELDAGRATEIEIARGGAPSILVEVRAIETEWEGEEARLVSLRDITDRRKAESRARRLLRERVARAEAEEAAWRAGVLAEAGRRLSGTLDLRTILQETAAIVVEKLGDFCMVHMVEAGRTQRFVDARSEEIRSALTGDGGEDPFSLEGDSPLASVYRERTARLVKPVTAEWLRAAVGTEAQYRALQPFHPRSIVLAPLYAGRECFGVLTIGCTSDDASLEDSHVHMAGELGQRVALAIENARLYRDAEAASRAKSDFLSVMSHELRTPLSAIIGYTDLIARGVAGETTEKQEQFLSRIRASSSHLLQIIEEILAFASTEAGEEGLDLEDTTLGAIVDAVLAVAEPLAADGRLEFRVDVQDADTSLRTDPRKIRQILLNLISNGLKFTQDGWVRLHTHADGGVVIFEVQDTGVGIPPDRLETIFERFWQVEDPMTRRAGGTGLGLTIARNFARILGGRLTVRSTLGEGSTFTLTVPRTPPA